MTYLAPRVYDYGLFNLVENSSRLVLLTELQTDHEAAVAGILGEVPTPVIAGPSNGIGGGRRVTVAAITGGVVSVPGSAGFWALLDDPNELVLACGPFASAMDLEESNTFDIPAFAIDLKGDIEE